MNFLFVQDWGSYVNLVHDSLDKFKDGLFIGRYFEMSTQPQLTRSMEVDLWDEKVHRYYLNHDTGMSQIIYQDILHHPLADFWTVTFPAMHFALFTYPRRIYLAGCDTTSRGHFYDDVPYKVDNTHKQKLGYARMKMFARQYYQETEIISINPVANKGLFSDMFSEEYLASLQPPRDEDKNTPTDNPAEMPTEKPSEEPNK